MVRALVCGRLGAGVMLALAALAPGVGRAEAPGLVAAESPGGETWREARALERRWRADPGHGSAHAWLWRAAAGYRRLLHFDEAGALLLELARDPRYARSPHRGAATRLAARRAGPRARRTPP